ncbi:hypothetical protein Peur_063945 [Populus x canadensis]
MQNPGRGNHVHKEEDKPLRVTHREKTWGVEAGRWLDLLSGTGSVGIEAISRGCSQKLKSISPEYSYESSYFVCNFISVMPPYTRVDYGILMDRISKVPMTCLTMQFKRPQTTMLHRCGWPKYS